MPRNATRSTEQESSAPRVKLTMSCMKPSCQTAMMIQPNNRIGLLVLAIPIIAAGFVLAPFYRARRQAILNARLLEAARLPNAAVVESLLRQGADANAGETAGSPPLLQAAQWGHPEVMRVLLEHGAHVNAGTQTGRTALIWTRFQSRQAVELLLDHGADVRAGAPLAQGIANAPIDIVKRIIRMGADVNAQSWYGGT